MDGNTTTRWASEEGADPQWISVDLGSAYRVSRVRLNWETAYAKSYRIQTSPDGTDWTDVYSTTTGDGATDDLPVNGTGRYVRVNGTARGTSFGYSLWEFEVYGAGPGGGDTTAPTIPGGLRRRARRRTACPCPGMRPPTTSASPDTTSTGAANSWRHPRAPITRTPG
ncbi:discoidin domain-containing protein [Streptomyces chartreusis]|uniref:discoidin domain-containing protein n=1 Tax=Streptomyces chartreusis TaxID=1969 RepID=UPI0036976DFD